MGRFENVHHQCLSGDLRTYRRLPGQGSRIAMRTGADRNRSGLIAALAAGVLVAVSGTYVARATGDADAHWKMLGDYCVKCHNATDWAGSVAFDAMQPGDIPHD